MGNRLATRLELLLRSIDPARTLDQVSARQDQALNSFRINIALIDRWPVFQQCLARFYRHVLATTLRARRPGSLPLAPCWGKCVQVLQKAYGSNGEKAAFEMARTGAEGGLYAVLRTIAGRVAEESAHNEIAARVQCFWNGLSVNEQLEVASQYVKRYGHLLPSELTEGSAARIRASFCSVLEKHPAMIRRLRRVSRSAGS